MTMTTDWYYGSNGERHGPVALDELQRLFVSGEVSARDLAWTDGFYDWRPVGEISELKAMSLKEDAPPTLPKVGQTASVSSQSEHAPSSVSPVTQVKVIEANSTLPLRTNNESRKPHSRSHADLPWMAWVSIALIALDLMDKLIIAVMPPWAGDISFSYFIGMFAGVVRNGVLFAVCLSLMGVTQRYLGFRFTNSRTSKIVFGVVGAITVLYFLVREFGQVTQWYAILGYQITLVSHVVHIPAVVAGVCGMLHFARNDDFNRTLVKWSVGGLVGYAALATLSLVIGLADGTLDTTVSWQLARNFFAIIQSGVAAVVVWKVLQLYWDTQPTAIKDQAVPSAIVSSTHAAGFKRWLSSVWGNTKAAGQLVAKQTEKTKLTTVTLPVAYRKLGQQIHGDGRLRGEHATDFDEIDRLQAELIQLQEASNTDKASQSVSAKAKGLADAAKRTTQSKVIEQKLTQAFAGLGKSAFEQHGIACGIEDLTSEISRSQSRLAALDAEIAELSKAGEGQLVTPRRIVIAGGCAVVILFIAAVSILFSPETADSYTNRAVKHTPSVPKAHLKALKQHTPKSRADFVQATFVLAQRQQGDFSFGQWDQGGEVKVSIGVGQHIDINTWIAVFGEPERLPDGYDVGSFQRWRHHCIDGPVRLHGVIIPNRSVSPSSAYFE